MERLRLTAARWTMKRRTLPQWHAQRSLVTSALSGPTAPWPRLRYASTSAGRSLLPASQLRRASFISAASRAIGRMGGRVVGLGAVGAGGAAYVGSQVDGARLIPLVPKPA